MKIYLFVLIALLFVTGCSTSTEPAGESTASTPGAAESPGPAVTTEGGSAKLNERPEDAVKAFIDAIKAKDEAGLKAAVSEKTFKMLELESKLSGNKDAGIFDSEDFEDIGDMPETRNESIDGEKATLEVREKGDKEWTKMPLIKEGGSWKLAFADDGYDKSYEEMSKKVGNKAEDSNASEPVDGQESKKPMSDN